MAKQEEEDEEQRKVSWTNKRWWWCWMDDNDVSYTSPMTKHLDFIVSILYVGMYYVCILSLRSLLQDKNQRRRRKKTRADQHKIKLTPSSGCLRSSA